MTHQAELDRLVDFFEHISPENIGVLTELYSAQAYFKDPFNEVRGHAAIIAIFEHMFRQADAPRFEVKNSILQGDDACILWEFHFNMRDKSHTPRRIRGSSHLHFTVEHKVDHHRDYWDAAEELYEKIPLLRVLMRWLKRQASAQDVRAQ